MESRYDTHIDPLTPNLASAIAIQLIGSGQRVLELGAASGFVTRALRERGNHVTAVESDARLAEDLAQVADAVVITDLNWLDLADQLTGQTFDVVLAGDVLEHCHDPDLVLHQAIGLLREGGSVIISVPNVAHGDVRLALLQGHFQYRETGLLDRTHLRFFTRASVEALLGRNGLVASEWLSTYQALGMTEVGDTSDFSDIPVEAMNYVRADRDSTVYQFVVRAHPTVPAATTPGAGNASTPRDALARAATLEDLVRRSRDLRAHVEAENLRLRGVIEELQTRAEAAERARELADDDFRRQVENLTALHRRKMREIRGTRWWRLGVALMGPRRAAVRCRRAIARLRPGSARRRAPR